MIRLATAHAKLRLSKQVVPSDVEIALELLNESIFQETRQNTKEVEVEEEPEEDILVDGDGDKVMIDEEQVLK